MLTANLHHEITGAQTGLKWGCTGLGLKVDGFAKAFIKLGQSFCESIKGQEKKYFFQRRGVFSLDSPFNGWPLVQPSAFSMSYQLWATSYKCFHASQPPSFIASQPPDYELQATNAFLPASFPASWPFCELWAMSLRLHATSWFVYFFTQFYILTLITEWSYLFFNLF